MMIELFLLPFYSQSHVDSGKKKKEMKKKKKRTNNNNYSCNICSCSHQRRIPSENCSPAANPRRPQSVGATAAAAFVPPPCTCPDQNMDFYSRLQMLKTENLNRHFDLRSNLEQQQVHHQSLPSSPNAISEDEDEEEDDGDDCDEGDEHDDGYDPGYGRESVQSHFYYCQEDCHSDGEGGKGNSLIH